MHVTNVISKLCYNQERKMEHSQLKEYYPFHQRWGRSRTRETAARLVEMNKLGSYHGKVKTEEALTFLFVLAASQGTKNAIKTAQREHKLVNSIGYRFVWVLGNLFTDWKYLRTVDTISIGYNHCIIKYGDGSQELFEVEGKEHGEVEVFDKQFLAALWNDLQFDQEEAYYL